MSNTTIENKLLEILHESWRSSNDLKPLVLSEFSEEHGIDLREASRLACNLDEEGLVTFSNIKSLRITPQGILEAESRNLVPQDAMKKVKGLRKNLLLALYSHENEGQEPLNFDIECYAKQQEITVEQFWKTVDILLANVFVTQKESYPPEMHPFGRMEARKLQDIRDRTGRFTEISLLNPSTRGRGFQNFVGIMLEQEGWKQTTGVRGSAEELDVVFSKGREYYLVECRWTNTAVEAKELRDFHGKLQGRISSVLGCFVSMSGFTEGAVETAERFLGDRLILLFGENDIRRWIDAEVQFEELLSEKIDAAFKFRQLTWK